MQVKMQAKHVSCVICLEVPLTKKASCLHLTFKAWEMAHCWPQTPAALVLESCGFAVGIACCDDEI